VFESLKHDGWMPQGWERKLILFNAMVVQVFLYIVALMVIQLAAEFSFTSYQDTWMDMDPAADN
jgi:hypothetical protein